MENLWVGSGATQQEAFECGYLRSGNKLARIAWAITTQKKEYQAYIDADITQLVYFKQ